MEKAPLSAAAPVRVDLGGTLDISTFHLPLRHRCPCTFNTAIEPLTRVRLRPYRPGWVRVTSVGFEPSAYPLEDAPFVHPLGLIFAIAAYFGVAGVHIDIVSGSPPRSALGGSSSAAVALIWALLHLPGDPDATDAQLRSQTVRLAHSLEASVAGVPCGMQDQLAAAYGGVHAWRWSGLDDRGVAAVERHVVLAPEQYPQLEQSMLVAYAGRTHWSGDINSQWVKLFLEGKNRRQWIEIIDCCNRFVVALEALNVPEAVSQMNRETDIRIGLTPGVFDDAGYALVAAARDQSCGARFTGAGGGGCIWALGSESDISVLKQRWHQIVSGIEDARLLRTAVASHGVAIIDECDDTGSATGQSVNIKRRDR